MKKNKMMRFASALLVLTLLSTCAISGTFAKYVTEATGTDNARVAYWGFDQTAWAEYDLFDDSYVNVKSNDGTNVVAPGTAKEETVSFTYDNTAGSAPEVAYNFSIVLDTNGSDTDALDENTNFVWTLKMPGDETATEYQTVALLKTAIESLNKTGETIYRPGEFPDGFGAGNNDITIGWKWNFSTSTEGDIADTAMGNADDLDNVKFVLTVNATQVD